MMASCGAGTSLDIATNSCQCDNATCVGGGTADTSKVYIAAMFDKAGFEWGEEIFNITVNMINDHTDGWFDHILADAHIETALVDTKCDPKISAPAYWDLKTSWHQPLHGVVGCRCSGATMAVARIAGLESVPQVSMSATSSKLSDIEAFPSFFRMVAPDDKRGKVGALVSLLRSFGWERVTVIDTDTQYTQDLSTEFRSAWVGEHSDPEGTWTGQVSYSHTVGLNAEGGVDEKSLEQALDGVPTDDPTINSRIIVLLAHTQHAFPIFRRARERNFQPDTVWVHSDATRVPEDISWMADTPGYLGLVTYRNRNTEYYDFLERLQEAQMSRAKEVTEALPDFAAEMVDAFLSLAIALSSLSPELRGNGSAVADALQNVTFPGVSGDVRFTAEGDRAQPRYTVVNFPRRNGDWEDVGYVGLDPNEVVITSDICFAEVGCGAAPSDRYPVPPPKLPVWVLVVVPLVSALVLALVLKYWRSKKRKKELIENITEMQKKLDAKNEIDDELEDLNNQVEKAKARQASLIQKRAGLQDTPPTWSDTTDILVELSPGDKEYWMIFGKLQETINNAWISKVWRIQNTPLWTYYSFHKDRLKMTGTNHNEKSVWHGTSSLEPSVIYNDKQDGFMMQFSRVGFWGRGIYFAAHSAYSNSYSFKPAPDNSERPGSVRGEREMFLAKLLIGNEVLMDRDESPSKEAECRALTVPPTDARTGLKHNTVTGHTGGSQVWIVYENGRAYPDYLVRYYCGKRDPQRTPFKTKKEAAKNTAGAASKETTFVENVATKNADVELGLSLAPPPSLVTWEYDDGPNGWKPYMPAAQAIIEVTFQAFTTGRATNQGKVQVRGDEWAYEVDVGLMVQTNTEHPNRTQRKIRRISARQTSAGDLI